MTKPNTVGSIGFPQQERMSRVQLLRKAHELDRQKNPHLYLSSPDGLGAKWLFVENVAAMLGTTVDFVRRINRRELPTAMIGKRVIYSREDVDAFIAERLGISSRHYVADRKPRAVSSQPDAGTQPKTGGVFDPVAIAKKALV
ncbi:helix-turn-helix domain-containing protein [Ensifer sp. NBAIM29]|nr:helix-turn-helix domain-containing protein [Ensifer sp. NBAIM29]